MNKVGIIRCQQTEDICPGTTCMKVLTGSERTFQDIGEAELVGFVSCGGCPGKRAVTRTQLMVSHGAEIIVLASCIINGTPIEFPCPHKTQMKEAIRKKEGENITILEGSH